MGAGGGGGVVEAAPAAVDVQQALGLLVLTPTDDRRSKALCG
jgi:hypothetical protein